MKKMTAVILFFYKTGHFFKQKGAFFAELKVVVFHHLHLVILNLTRLGLCRIRLKMAAIVFDGQLSIWRLRSWSTGGVKNALVISHFIKFNPLFFQKKLIKNEKMVEVELLWSNKPLHKFNPLFFQKN